MGKEYLKNDIHVSMNHFSVQKLTQHYKSTILQFKKLDKIKKSSTSFYSNAVVGLFSRSKHSFALSLQVGLKII